MGKQFNPRAKVYNSLPKSCHIFRQKHVRLCKKNGCGERPLLPEILGQTGPVGAKLTPIFSRYSLVAPQPQGRIQRGRGAGGPCPPIVDRVDFLRKNGFIGTVLSTRNVLWASNMPKMRWLAEIRPGPRCSGGAHDAPELRPPSRLGRGHPLPKP